MTNQYRTAPIQNRLGELDTPSLLALMEFWRGLAEENADNPRSKYHQMFIRAYLEHQRRLSLSPQH